MRHLTVLLRRIPVRLKLTLMFAGATAVLLSALGVSLYFRFQSGLDQAVNQQLRAHASEIAGAELAARPGSEPLRARRGTAQVLDRYGRVIDSSVGLPEPLLSPSLIAAALRHPLLIPRRADRRLYAMPIEQGGEVVVVSMSLAQRGHALETLRASLLIGGPLTLALASLVGYMLAAAALHPVERMRRRAATISSGDVGARLPLPDSVDEVHRLGSTLNEMLARLEQGLEHERAFVADASHELRSPLTVLKAELEVALLENGGEERLREAVRSAVEETDRVIALAEDLLVLARAEQGTLPLELDHLPAADLLDELRHRYATRTARAGRLLLARVEDGVVLRGDRSHLLRALSNLVDNALRYGQGPIEVQARAVDDRRVELHVTDEGAGFPPELLAHAFERFTRADPARTRDGGVGLGLAIVEAIAHAHHGRLQAANRQGGGADVWLTLPGAGARLSG